MVPVAISKFFPAIGCMYGNSSISLSTLHCIIIQTRTLSQILPMPLYKGPLGDRTTVQNRTFVSFKTKYMVFTRHRDIHLRVRIHDTDIEQVSEFNYLGLIIDRNLSFKNHILEITRKINRVNGVLNSLKHFLPMYIGNLQKEMIVDNTDYNCSKNE